MHYVSPAFWAQADGDVRLWVPFNSNLSNDVSLFAHGAGTNTGATISGGQLVMAGATVQQIVWGPSSTLALTDAGWTLECFITWTSSAGVGLPGGDMMYQHNVRTHNWHPYDNAGKVALDTSDFGAEGNTATNVLAGAGKVHLAMVRPAGSGAQVISCYVAGVRYVTFTETGSPGTLTSGTISIGKTSATGNCAISQDDVRFTLRARYSGTSFTPPTSPL